MGYRTERRSLPRPRFLLATLLLAAAAVILPGCSSDDETAGPTIRHPEDFLPPGTEGMPKDGPTRTATTTQTLQDIVNGGYEVYTNNGFRELAEQKYSGTVGTAAANFTVWIFDMGTAANAQALHDELTQVGTWETAGEVGEEDHRQTALFAYTILFRRGKYSVRLESSVNSQDAQDLLVLFATHVDQEITGQG